MSNSSRPSVESLIQERILILDGAMGTSLQKQNLTAEHFELEHAPIDTIYLDANFSPVKKVNFQVEDARVGQTTDYEKHSCKRLLHKG